MRRRDDTSGIHAPQVSDLVAVTLATNMECHDLQQTLTPTAAGGRQQNLKLGSQAVPRKFQGIADVRNPPAKEIHCI